jgi:hypothetical protein
VTVTLPGDTYHWLSPVTGNTVQLPQLFPIAGYARLRVMSTVQAPNTAIFRVVVCDDGPDNIFPLAWLTNSRPGPGNISNDAIDFTAALNGHRPIQANLGWQMAGDNTHPVTIYNVRFEIGWLGI